MNLFTMNRRIRALALTIATVGAGSLAAAPAQASLLNLGPSAPNATCATSDVSQPFAPWGDHNDYVLAPGGAFSGSSTDWTLSRGARLVPGGEPYNVAGSAAPASLSLPAGSSAQSPFTCVNLSRPTFRFFGRNSGLLSTVLVQVVIKLPVVGELPVPVGTLALSGKWQPSLQMLTTSGLTGTGEVALRFTALTGTSQFDDVFVDPRMSR